MTRDRWSTASGPRRAIDPVEQPRDVDRLGDDQAGQLQSDLIGPGLQETDCDETDRHFRTLCPQPVEEGDPVDAGHGEVKQGRIIMPDFLRSLRASKPSRATLTS